MAYEVPELHVNLLLQACGLKEFDAEGNPTPIPQHVVDSFEKIHRAMNRMGYLHFEPSVYAIAAAFAGEAVAKPCDQAQANVAVLWAKKQLQHGDSVVVEWRGESRIAKILNASVRNKTATVQFENDPTERKVPVDTVSLPEPAEL